MLLGAVAVIYAVFAKLFLAFATANGNVSFIYPPSGIALAALLLFGQRMWPAIFIGSLLESVWVNDPVWVAALISTGNTLSAIVAYRLLNKLNFDHTFARFHDVYILAILSGAVSSVIAAVIGVTALAFAGIVELHRFPVALVTWWGGDALGVILFTPLILAWRKFPPSWFKPQRLVEVVIFYTLAWMLCQIIFFDQFAELLVGYSTEFWITPFIFYAALRLGLRGTLLLLAIIVAQVSLGTANHMGAFAHDLHDTGMANVWLYLVICTLIGLSLTVLIKQRNRDERNLKESERRLQEMAFHDTLTGLPNRALFFDRLSKSIALAKRNHGHLALIYLDLDGFKPINDQYGHEAGDNVLKQVAQRLNGCVRDVDTVARLGGDEFAVVLDGLDTPGEAAKVAQKILHILSMPIQFENDGDSCQAHIGASIGIAIYPDNGVAIDALIAAADASMYDSKRSGKNKFSFCAATEGATQGALRFDPSSNQALGFAELDMQHQQLGEIIKRLHMLVDSDRDWHMIKRTMNDLESALARHFALENRLIVESGFPNPLLLKDHHLHLAKELGFIKMQFADDNKALAIQRIKDWCRLHLEGDRALAEHLTKNIAR
ncbi:MAG TPA: diguanylate cyclase [Sideroxyarcus sp.]|nr:diguanylate cyclase [Sideroxyarcus sp.]